MFLDSLSNRLSADKTINFILKCNRGLGWIVTSESLMCFASGWVQEPLSIQHEAPNVYIINDNLIRVEAMSLWFFLTLHDKIIGMKMLTHSNSFLFLSLLTMYDINVVLKFSKNNSRKVKKHSQSGSEA